MINYKDIKWQDLELIFLIGSLNKIECLKDDESLNYLVEEIKRLNVLFPNDHTSHEISITNVRKKLYELKSSIESTEKNIKYQGKYIVEKLKNNPEGFDDLVFSLNLLLNQSCVIKSTFLNYSASEGNIAEKKHFEKERDWKIIKAKKESVLLEKGVLECDVCNFNFSNKYGDRGHNYLEVHHIKPISEYQNEEITLLKDLCVLCSNCHRMIHRKKPWLSIGELKQVINQDFVA